MHRRLFILGLSFLLAVIPAGCGQTGPKVYEVTGTVSLDGTDIPKGDIYFYPEEKDQSPDRGEIIDGKYKAKVKGGKKKVQIKATRPVPGKKDPMGTGDAIEDYIPAKYNDKTELTAEIGDGKTEHSFPLKSK
jgi:hypothetical protein